MPTILRQEGYKFKIYPNDHPPAHIHVQNAEKEARVTLDPIEVQTNIGFNEREISFILEMVDEHQEQFLEVWDTYHPNR